MNWAPKNFLLMKYWYNSSIYVSRKEIFCGRKLYRENPLGNVEQAPSPAPLKNSRGRLFYIFSSSGVAKIVHDGLAHAIRPKRKNAGLSLAAAFLAFLALKAEKSKLYI
jgi:hypothetical protein